MALKSFNPVTPSLRGTILVDRSELWKGKPVKGLTEGEHSSGGRNQHGRTTVRFRGGGHKQSYRIVDFKRRAKLGVAAVVERLEYDPNRTAWIALLKYADGELSYIVAPQRLKAGDSVIAAETSSVVAGFTSTGVDPCQRPRQSCRCGSISCASVDTPFGPSDSVSRAMNVEIRSL